MAAFNIEVASKTIPLFAGHFEELESFLITTELVNKTLSETGKQDFLQYIYHAKLTSTVRTAIGNYIKPENLDELKKLLRQRYKNTKTIPELQSKLNNIYQGKLSVNAYKERIDNIIDNLNRLNIEELGNAATEAEKNIIVKLNHRLALETFKRGINDNLKTAIFAARPKTMQEAVELALELENENKLTTNNKILQIHKRQFNTNHTIRQQQFSGNTNRNQYVNNRNNSHRNNNFLNRPIHKNNSYNNRNNYRQENNRTNNYSRNNRNNIYTIQGNEIGSECISIPESQN